MFDEKRIAQILCDAHNQSHRVLLEAEGFEILRALGFQTAASVFVRDACAASQANWDSFKGDKVVVKVVSPDILHKSDVGGIAIVPNERNAIASEIETMQARLRANSLVGFTVNQFVSYDASFGGELLLGFRNTDDFGPVVTLSAGGIYTEFLADNFKPGRDTAIISTELTGTKVIEKALRESAVWQLVTNPPRGQKPRLRMEQLLEATDKLLWLAKRFGALIGEFEINPLVIAEGELVALDVLIKLTKGCKAPINNRPVEKIKHLLEPRSVAVIGVSERLNPGHVIVNNLLREGFDANRLYIVKPESERLEGCACYPDISSLPERVDLLVVSVAAAQVPETIIKTIETRRAESIIVIPGGLEEKSGGEQLTSRVRMTLAAAREADWRGPVINGGNCLGIRSRPGRCDTMFIPQHKLSSDGAQAVSPVALISQSGAFALAQADRLQRINPKYNITLGNQMDLTIGDYLTYLKADSEVEVFAVYVEGFAPLDGIKFLKAAEEIVAGGRIVVLYRAGRTPAGKKASCSHTASIAGDYAVTTKLARQAGVVVAETLADFEDLIKLFTMLRGKNVAGRRLGAISNAGFECVAIADNIGNLTLPNFAETTTNRLRSVFERCHIDLVVDAHNPVDLTPMADDVAYEQSIFAVMQDENVDIGVVGCVPMTPALNTLERSERHREDLAREDSIVQRWMRLRDQIEKPWVAVVDAGVFYDPMVAALEGAGVPTFRRADRAVRLLGVFCDAKC